FRGLCKQSGLDHQILIAGYGTCWNVVYNSWSCMCVAQEVVNRMLSADRKKSIFFKGPPFMLMNAIKALKNMLEQQLTPPTNITVVATDDNDNDNDFKEFTNSNPAQMAQGKLDAYLGGQCEFDKTKTALYWRRANQVVFPGLPKFERDYLAVSGMTCVAEQVFSGAAVICSQDCKGLCSTTITSYRFPLTASPNCGTWPLKLFPAQSTLNQMAVCCNGVWKFDKASEKFAQYFIISVTPNS
ncbi:hypothetical protein DFH28DRAFT_1145086, partial [Melampsora americana]